LDASRPWMMYWVLCGLSLMGHDISPYRERLEPSDHRSYS
jgi:protein farnesyltransferase subunit beta